MATRVNTSDDVVLVLSYSEFQAINSLLYEYAGNPELLDPISGLALTGAEKWELSNMWKSIHNVT